MTTKGTNPDPTPNASIPNVAFDLASLDTGKASDDGAEVELTHPISGAPLGMFINVLGKHSQVFRDHLKERTNARLRKDALARRRGKDPETPTAEQAEAEAVELLTLCTLGWRTETYELDANKKKVVKSNEPTLLLNGEQLTFNANNATMLYDSMIWVREQVDAFIGDLENFIKG